MSGEALRKADRVRRAQFGRDLAQGEPLFFGSGVGQREVGYGIRELGGE